MKILQVHNYYQQAGGEDAVVAAELALLREHGHEVIVFYKSNKALGTGLRALLRAGLETVWNQRTYREFSALLRKERPDGVHCHNIFPLISPAVYWACARERIPVVQTLHNYRLLCLNAFLFREPHGGDGGTVCELCVGRAFKRAGIKYGCYRGSRAGSLTVALMLLVHRVLGTWTRKVSAYIVLTEFQRRKMIQGGLPAGKIRVIPNFVPDGEPFGGAAAAAAPYVLFVGRLSPEKGCALLLEAWRRFYAMPASGIRPRLVIIGDGPERARLEQAAGSLKDSGAVQFEGRMPKESVRERMRGATLLVVPSVCYETFGLVAAEAGLLGVPSLVASPCATAELVEDGVSGFLFQSGSADDLAKKLYRAFMQPERLAETGRRAAALFRERYTAPAHYEQLLACYRAVRAAAEQR